MLPIEKQCEMLAAGVRDKSKVFYDSFKLFIQMFAAFVAGVVVLRLQYPDKVPANFVPISDVLAAVIVVTPIIILLDNYRSWLGYRRTLSAKAGKDESGQLVIPPPNIWRAGVSLAVMLLVMMSGLLGFWCFNPLRN